MVRISVPLLCIVLILSTPAVCVDSDPHADQSASDFHDGVDDSPANHDAAPDTSSPKPQGAPDTNDGGETESLKQSTKPANYSNMASKKKKAEPVTKIKVMPTFPLDGFYAVGDGEKICILLKAGIRFTFAYTNASSNQTVNEALIDLSVHNHTVEGECDKDHQRISIIFYPAEDSHLKWNFTLNFDINATNPQHIYSSLMRLDFTLKTGVEPFPWAQDTTSSSVALQSSSAVLSMAPDKTFLCMAEISIQNFTTGSPAVPAAAGRVPAAEKPGPGAAGPATTAGPDKGGNKGAGEVRNGLVLVRLYGAQIEAFRTVNNTVFSTTVIQCAADSKSMTVPLAVGVLLFSLIITVLVVFVIRRRMINNYDKVNKR